MKEKGGTIIFLMFVIVSMVAFFAVGGEHALEESIYTAEDVNVREEVVANVVEDSILGLLAEGLVTSFDDWYNGRQLAPPAVPLDEAGRCADWILHEWQNRAH